MPNPNTPTPENVPPMHLPETDPEFPNIVKPQEGDRNAFQQPVRVGDHERVLAKMGGEEAIYAEPAVGADLHNDPNNRGDQRARQEEELGRTKAEQHKAFIDANNVRTEDQAEAEESARPKVHEDMPDATETTPAGKDVGQKSKTVAKGQTKK